MERRAETTIAVLAALFVLFSAMIDPLVSVIAAVAGVVVLALVMAGSKNKVPGETRR
ncbi:hypothetical protein [Methanoculleus frigidifontis]|uniref:hypothetical protein n=1 Tax=Methanoculleus frigidifontis TaxID=2584085 RepID=UPI00265B2856|nr:hypothetical protein [Methanoculleus sp. FWC-SCC1]